MDDLPPDFKPENKSHKKTIILIIAVVAVISVAAFNSYQTKYVEEPSDLHAALVRGISITYQVGNAGGLNAEIINDGVVDWDIDSVDIIGAHASCNKRKIPKDVKPNETIKLSCSATNIDNGQSYPVVIYVKQSDNESNKYMLSGIAAVGGTW